MKFNTVVNCVDCTKPLLYLWRIYDDSGNIWYRYVGKAKNGADRPKKTYPSVVRRCLTGKPRRPNNPEYRDVHQKMAEAVQKGFVIELTSIRNVPDNENIFEAEREAQQQYCS